MKTMRRLRRFGWLTSVAMVLSTARLGLGAPGTPDAGRSVVRAIWVTRWDFRTEEDIRRAIRWCAGYGFNRIFFQVRGRADALYRSELEPWAEELGGDPGFDPLEVAIAEAQAYGVGLDAWVNLLPAWKGLKDPDDPGHVLHKRPEWFLTDRQGKQHLKVADDYTILNPCLPDVRAYLVAIVRDIATRYPVHGVHLDYVRFVGRDAARRTDFPYDTTTTRLFRKHAGAWPWEAEAEWDRWRGLAVDSLLFRVAEAARQARPGAVVSVAAIADYDRARNDLFQDVVKWQRQGWVDEVYPMTYYRTTADFTARARTALTTGTPGKVYPGIGSHLQSTAAASLAQIDAARSLGARGYAIFAYASLFPSPSHESLQDAASKRLRADLRDAIGKLHRPPSTAAAPRARAPAVETARRD